MYTTKIFKSGNSQAVRIPKEYKIEGNELFINKIGNSIIICPKNDPWKTLMESLSDFSNDYFRGGRNQPKTQKRGEI